MLFQRDIHMWWLPRMESFVRAWHEGAWPVWDPWRAFGQPHLADPSAQVYYPFTWLNLVLSPGPSYTVLVLGHWLLSAAGLYALSRSWAVSPGGAFVAAALWMASPLVALITLPHHLAGAAWMPWVLAAAERALVARTLPSAVLCAVVMALQILAGSADMVASTWAIVGVFTVARHRDPRAIAAVSGAAVLALGLCTAQWWPTVAMAAGAERFAHAESSRTTWSVHPLAFLEMLVPLRWFALPLTPAWRQALAPEVDAWLTTLYIGVPALALVAAAFVPAALPRRRLLLAIGVAACLVALGRHAPFYGWVVALVPPLSALRFPVKAMVAGAFAWSLLAGLGWDVWWADSSTARRWHARVAAVLAAGTALAALGGLAALGAGPIPSLLRPDASMPLTVRWRLGAAAVVAAAMLVLALLRARGRRPSLAIAAAVLAVGSVVGAHLWLESTAASDSLRYRPPVLEWVRPGSRVYVRDYSVRTRAERLRGAVVTTPYAVVRRPEGASMGEALMLGAHAYLNPPTAARWGVRGSYDLDLLGLYDPWLAEMTQAFRESEGTPRHLRLLQVGGVDHVLGLRDSPDWQVLEPVATVPGFFQRPIRVFRVPDPLPMAYAVGRAEIAPDFASSWARLSDPAFDPRTTVLLSEGENATSRADFRGAVEVLLRKPDRLRIATELSGPGHLVLLEGYDPGWQATVDGRPAPVRRANAIFREVPVPAGSHVVEMVYRPRAIVAGAGVSAAFLLAAVASTVWARRRA